MKHIAANWYRDLARLVARPGKKVFRMTAKTRRYLVLWSDGRSFLNSKVLFLLPLLLDPQDGL